MEDKIQPNERHIELSLMFLKMGQALVEEGLENKDYITASLGNVMIFMSSTTSDRDEVKLLADLCNMMSSRKLIKGVTDGTFDITKLGNLKDVASKDTFQEILKKIRKNLDGDDTSDEK
jgi:hypothetical protein